MTEVTSGLDADVLQRANRIIDLTGKMGDTSATRAVAIELVAEVERLRAVVELARRVDEAFSRDAPMMLIDPGLVAEKKLEALRTALDVLGTTQGG